MNKKLISELCSEYIDGGKDADSSGAVGHKLANSYYLAFGTLNPVEVSENGNVRPKPEHSFLKRTRGICDIPRHIPLMRQALEAEWPHLYDSNGTNPLRGKSALYVREKYKIRVRQVRKR